MKSIHLISLLCLSSGPPLAAQETGEVQLLRRQVQELRENFEKIQQQQRAQIEALQKQLDALQASRAAALPGTNAPASLAAPESAPETAKRSWSPSDPIRLGRGSSFLDLSLNGLFAAGGSTAEDVESLQLGGHDPSQRGFTVQNLEAILSGAVDPYFRGQANLLFLLDSRGETGVELEEAWLETISLPGNFQIRAGQILTEFGRHNPTHPHTWSFVDTPLVAGRFLGSDGLRNPGARISWLAPTPFYSELFLSVQNSHGETAHSFRNDHENELFFGRPQSYDRVKSPGDLLFTPRYVMSFDLTDAQTLLAGASAAFGPNASGSSSDTQIYGADLFWKWKPATHSGGFPFVSWQTEGMLRRYQAGAFAEDADGDGVNEVDLPSETLKDYGFYSQLSYGFRRGWVAAMRGEAVSGDEAAFYPDPDRDSRWRLSPNLTWYPSEFSKIRLQYNYDDRKFIGLDHSIWLQFEFMLGAHGAHKF